MAAPDIYGEFAMPENRVAMREALRRHTGWFLRAERAAFLEDIKREGRRPRPIESAREVDVVRLREVSGGSLLPITCLWSTSAAHALVHDVGEPLVVFAVPIEDLPDPIGIDWSVVGAWNLAADLRREAPKRSVGEVFSDVVRRSGIVVTYGVIQPAALRVRLSTSTDDWREWPTLADVEDLAHVSTVNSFGRPASRSL